MVHPLQSIHIKNIKRHSHLYLFLCPSIVPVKRLIYRFHRQRTCFVFFAFAARFIAIILHHDVFSHVKLANGCAFSLIQQIHILVANRIWKGIIVSAHRRMKPVNGVTVPSRKRENAFAHEQIFSLARLHKNVVALSQSLQ